MSANYIMCLSGIKNVDDVTRNVKLKIIFYIFSVLSHLLRGVYYRHGDEFYSKQTPPLTLSYLNNIIHFNILSCLHINLRCN